MIRNPMAALDSKTKRENNLTQVANYSKKIIKYKKSAKEFNSD